jgi:beta-lactamase superfamily II metal-dependent hydrolase
MPRKLKTTVTVRMYNVGFGDAFLVTVKQGPSAWRMLVDCGVFPAGQTRPITESVKIIIDDVTALALPGTPPHLDVVVATHHHIDHISGFADPAWTKVQVDDVWVPYVEDPDDEDGKHLRGELAVAAQALRSLIATAAMRISAANESAHAKLEVAEIFAANSQGSDPATDRLLGRNGTTFLNKPAPRFVPDRNPAKNVIATTVPGVTAYILGPSRDPNVVKLMKPPRSVAWLKAAADERPEDADTKPLFDKAYAVPTVDVNGEIPGALLSALGSLDLDSLSNADELLAAAAILENSVNNTSIYFVLDVKGTRLVFVGDSQHGAWEHVLNDPDSLKLVTDPAFYKIGHHGSHNATPKKFAKEVFGRGHYAMMPFGPVRQWPSIPEPKLLSALKDAGTHVVRADEPLAGSKVKMNGSKVQIHPDKIWSEVSFTES